MRGSQTPQSRPRVFLLPPLPPGAGGLQKLPTRSRTSHLPGLSSAPWAPVETQTACTSGECRLFWKPQSWHAEEPELTCWDPLSGGLSPAPSLQGIRGSKRGHAQPPSPARPARITRNSNKPWGCLLGMQGNLDTMHADPTAIRAPCTGGPHCRPGCRSLILLPFGALTSVSRT